MRHATRPLLALASATLLATACKNNQDWISQEYGTCYVGTERVMTVMCMESPYAHRPVADRQVAARKVATWVRDHHEKYKGADAVTVMFLGKEKDLTPDLVKRQAPRYTFTRAELGSPAVAGAPNSASSLLDTMPAGANGAPSPDSTAPLS